MSMANSMKYILVTGGVISGIGKGVLSSSLGVILKACGLRVTAIKIDPYINIDAGTFSPYEHGEVFVLDDGSEVDLDLGNYERFLDINLTKDNNITTGKIYQDVIMKERRGDYLGKTVQVIPHITNTIQEWVENVSKISVENNNLLPEICIIELGGTVGDIESMPFLEAFRQLKFRLKNENFCSFHLSLILKPKSINEHKTKPTQMSVREIRSLGISPDFIICRSEDKINDSVKEKVSNFCNLDKEFIINIPDLSSVYDLPLEILDQNIVHLLSKKLNLPNLKITQNIINDWKILSKLDKCCNINVKIALVGKYTKLEDSYASVIKALNHASLKCKLKLDLIYIEACDLEKKMEDICLKNYETAWEKIKLAEGILIPGGFGLRGTNGKIRAIEYARENKVPLLGICLGLQLIAIEFARNVLKIKDADSVEFNQNTTEPIIIEMHEHNQGNLGGTMRLGKRITKIKDSSSILKKLYNKKIIEERHRHRFEINIDYVERFNNAGLKFVGHDESGKRMEMLELENHPFFIAVQYHPEYLSKPNYPSPPYLGLILSAKKDLERYFRSNNL